MKILFEGHHYDRGLLKGALADLDDSLFNRLTNQVKVDCVGYYFDAELNDCVLVLPKVLLDENDAKALKDFTPEQLIDFTAAIDAAPKPGETPVDKGTVDFLREFAVWIYRAVSVYRKAHPNSELIDDGDNRSMTEGGGKRVKSDTILDIVLEMIRFNRENQDFFTFILKNIHRGYNKINWQRTVAKGTAFVQKGTPVYVSVVNRKRVINFDEELLVIFFSILNYCNEKYGFNCPLRFGFELIDDKKIEKWCKTGYGARRLLQIRYKYFSDRALRLWDLCHAFFDRHHRLWVQENRHEHLLVKDFNVVFEAMIDDLLGDSDLNKTISDLKNNKDGKRLDHVYKYKSLTNHEEDREIYYIGDSKYYKIGADPGEESVYKQYTYAKNLIQQNLDIFLNEPTVQAAESKAGVPKYRDDVTEGYNVVPNFFISARMFFDGEGHRVDTKGGHGGLGIEDRRDVNGDEVVYLSRQFENRLFDRDTLLVCHYDVNFLYVLTLYARQKKGAKGEWKQKVRQKFREDIQKAVEKRFEFYAMCPHNNVDAGCYFREHFQETLGRVYQPFADKRYYSLALNRDDAFKASNKKLYAGLHQAFHIAKCALGENPKANADLQKLIANDPTQAAAAELKDGVLAVMMENYEAKSKSFLPAGCIAIGLRDSKEGQEIAWNLSRIQYLFFHVRSKAGELQHLFHVHGLAIKSVVDIDGLYKAPTNAERYVVVNFDHNFELNAESLNASLMPYEQKTRYDPQFVPLGAIKKT